MKVQVQVIDDDGKTETFQLERIERPGEKNKSFVKFHVGDRSSPLIATAWVRKKRV